MCVALLNGCAQQRVDRELSSTDVYQRLAAASVMVLVDGRMQGSGWFVEHGDEPGLVVTAAHVVWPRQQCEVVTADGRRLKAEAIAWDRAHDAVLMRADVEDDADHARLPLARTMPATSTQVFLFGSPQFRHNVMITGHVARGQPSFEYYADGAAYLRCYHVSAPAPQGASGGCWVDATGRVVGLQSGLMRDGGGAAGIAFASDVAAVHRLLETREDAANPTAGMAVEELWEHAPEFIARYEEHDGGLVARAIVENGPAHEAGISDMAVILTVEGERVQYRDEFYNLMRRHAPGEQMTLRIIGPDTDQPRDVTLELGSLERG